MRRRLLWALVGGVVAVWSLVVSDLAAAASPSCATPPAAYTGTDATVAAITQENIDVDSNCAALSSRLDKLDADVTGFESANHVDLAAVNGTLSGWTSSNPLAVSLPAGGSGQAVSVTNWPADQTVGFDSSSSGQLDGEAHSNHEDLWILIGTVVGCMLFDVFLRKVWP